MKVVENENLTPICPHCEEELDEVHLVKDEGSLLGGRWGSCYVCPHCRKVLGFADYST